MTALYAVECSGLKSDDANHVVSKLRLILDRPDLKPLGVFLQHMLVVILQDGTLCQHPSYMFDYRRWHRTDLPERLRGVLSDLSFENLLATGVFFNKA